MSPIVGKLQQKKHEQKKCRLVCKVSREFPQTVLQHLTHWLGFSFSLCHFSTPFLAVRKTSFAGGALKRPSFEPNRHSFEFRVLTIDVGTLVAKSAACKSNATVQS